MWTVPENVAKETRAAVIEQVSKREFQQTNEDRIYVVYLLAAFSGTTVAEEMI